MSFAVINDFEEALATYTGASWAILTDNCTNALELCFRYDKVEKCAYTAYTYLSIHQLMHRLEIDYELKAYEWFGEYQFEGTRIWDSARKLTKDMYRPGHLLCLSFGWEKPLYLGWGGAILTDDYKFYQTVVKQRYDGRDLYATGNWGEQELPEIGYHMRPTPELAMLGLEKLKSDSIGESSHKKYPDGRNIKWQKNQI